MHHLLIRIANLCLPMRFTIIQYSNQFAFGGWSWRVLSYRVQRKVITLDLGRSYLLLTRAKAVNSGWPSQRQQLIPTLSCLFFSGPNFITSLNKCFDVILCSPCALSRKISFSALLRLSEIDFAHHVTLHVCNHVGLRIFDTMFMCKAGVRT